MGTTIYNPEIEIPTATLVPLVQIRKRWSDAWEDRPDLVPAKMSVHVGSEKPGGLQLSRRYGNVKEPWESAYQVREPIEIVDWWVQVIFVQEAAGQVVWIGRIGNQSRSVLGCSGATAPEGGSGTQEWVAYEPIRWLEKINVHRSYWLTNGLVSPVNWVPDFNRSDPKRDAVLGNRSADPDNDHYLFGGDEFWTRRQALEYLLACFADGERVRDYLTSNLPVWTVAAAGRAAEALDRAATVVRVSESQNLADMIRKLIPLDRGLEFRILPSRRTMDDDETPDGLVLEVFSLADEAKGAAGEVLPAGSRGPVLDLDADQTITSAVLNEAAEHCYDRIRVLGNRIVVCATVRPDRETPDLEPGWTTELETAYKLGAGPEATASGPLARLGPSDGQVSAPGGHPFADGDTVNVSWAGGGGLRSGMNVDYTTAINIRVSGGTGDDLPENGTTVALAISQDAEIHDQTRKLDLFRSVYRLFKVPTDWARNLALAAPQTDRDGQIELFEDGTPISLYWQSLVRKTLGWTPLKAGWDYRNGTPTDHNPGGLDPDLLPPAVWVLDPDTERYILADELGMHVAGLDNELGVFLSPGVNHILALNHFGGAVGTQTQPVYDFSKMIVTLAFESDQRLCVEYVEAETERPSGGAGCSLDLVVPDAELWYVAPNTCTGIDATPGADEQGKPRSGQPVWSGSAPQIVRNDRDQLRAILAGAVARYRNRRLRAEVVHRGIQNQYILGLVYPKARYGGKERKLGCACTGIDWTFAGEPVTSAHFGYAE